MTAITSRPPSSGWTPAHNLLMTSSLLKMTPLSPSTPPPPRPPSGSLRDLFFFPSFVTSVSTISKFLTSVYTHVLTPKPTLTSPWLIFCSNSCIFSSLRKAASEISTNTITLFFKPGNYYFVYVVNVMLSMFLSVGYIHASDTWYGIYFFLSFPIHRNVEVCKVMFNPLFFIFTLWRVIRCHVEEYP